MKRLATITALACIMTAPCFAGWPRSCPLDKLLRRARIVFIGQLTGFADGSVTLEVKSKERGSPAERTITLKFISPWRQYGPQPKVGVKYFVLSQGDQLHGAAQDQIKIDQGFEAQNAYCGWLMLPIITGGETDLVQAANDITVPLEDALKLTREGRFEGIKENLNKAAAADR